MVNLTLSAKHGWYNHYRITLFFYIHIKSHPGSDPIDLTFHMGLLKLSSRPTGGQDCSFVHLGENSWYIPCLAALALSEPPVGEHLLLSPAETNTAIFHAHLQRMAVSAGNRTWSCLYYLVFPLRVIVWAVWATAKVHVLPSHWLHQVCWQHGLIVTWLSDGEVVAKKGRVAFHWHSALFAHLLSTKGCDTLVKHFRKELTSSAGQGRPDLLATKVIPPGRRGTPVAQKLIWAAASQMKPHGMWYTSWGICQEQGL